MGGRNKNKSLAFTRMVCKGKIIPQTVCPYGLFSYGKLRKSRYGCTDPPGRDIAHTCQLSGFWTESPSFLSHQNLRPHRSKSPSFEHRRIFFPFLGHHLIFFGNPVELISKVAATKTKRSGSL